METWNCIEFEELLQETLDARRPIGSLGVSEQAIPCAHCRRLWAGFAQIDRALPGWVANSMEFDGADAVIAHVILEAEAGERSLVGGKESPAVVRSTSGAGRRHRGAAVVVAAAAVLFAVALPLFRSWENGTRVANVPGNGSPQRDVPQEVTPGPPDNPSEEIAALVREAGSAYFVLAREAGTTVSSVRRLVPEVQPEKVRELESALSVGEEASAWFDSIGEDLKPVGEDVGRAMNFLLQAVAVDDNSAI